MRVFMYDKSLVVDILNQIIDAIETVEERCALLKLKMILWIQKRGKKS